MLKHLPAFLLILLSIPSTGQSPLFRHFTTEDGLPSSQVYQALEDPEGYMWFATDHGLARYNGYEFKSFSSKDGLADNTVFKIQPDKENRLWMQTVSGQLFYFTGNRIVPYRFNDRILKEVNNHTPDGFIIDDETIYYTASWIGINKIDKDGNNELLYNYYSGTDFNKLFFFSAQNKHYLSAGFVNEQVGHTYIYVRKKDSATDTFEIKQPIAGPHDILETANGKLILSANGKLFDLSKSGSRELADVGAGVISLFEDKKARLWVCTYGGLFLFNNIYINPVPLHYLEKKYVSGACEDREGGIWFTTINNGIYYLSDDKIKSLVFDMKELSEPTSLAALNNNIYAGFWNGKVVELNSKNYRLVYSSNSGNPVSTLYADQESERLYIAKDTPGYIRDELYTPLKTPIDRTLKGNFVKRKNGEIYNGSINHLFKITNDSLILITPLTKRVNCTFETGDGRIILGCNKGAFVYNENTHELSLVHAKLNDLRVDDITSLNGALFLATRGKGLYILKDNEITAIDETDGLSSNIIHRLIAGNNTIWCLSFNGISRVKFTGNDYNDYSISNISIDEGLPSNEINAGVIMNDTLWLASKNAISFFNVNADFANLAPPLIKITGLKINNKDTVVKSDYDLSHNANTITINFEAISFRNPGDIIYNYSLVNEQDTFSSSTVNRQVEFLSLRPGNYNFSFSAVNSSGIKSEQLQLQFTILKPFWQRLWFILLLSSLTAAIVFIIMKQRINSVRKQESMKTTFHKQLVRLEIKALRAQMNPHFIFNVMNSIQDYILKNDTKAAQRYLTKFARLVRLILDNSINEEVLLSDELKAAQLYIELEQQRFDNKFDFELIADNIDSSSILIPSMIIQPYLENAIKHGIRHLEGKGRLSLEIKELDDSIFIAIEDNGIGRKAASEWNKVNERAHISHGSIITANRIQAYNIAHNTNILTTVKDILNNNGEVEGTRVELNIPVRNKGEIMNMK